MSKLRTLLVDDESLALNLLRSIVSEIDDIEIIGECKNGREAIESHHAIGPGSYLSRYSDAQRQWF